MEFAIEFGGNVEDVTITLSGVATPSGFQAFIEARVLDTRFRTGMLILVDASQLDTSEMSAEMLQAAMEPLLEREWRQPPQAVAILAVDAPTFGDAVITRAHLGGSNSRRSVFASRDEALRWLEQQRRPDPGAS
jgi:hypothetical protein